MNTLRQNVSESSLNPANWSAEARTRVAETTAVVAIGAAAVGYLHGQSEQQVPVFAECTGTQTVDVGSLETYGELVVEHTRVTHEDGSAGSDADLTRIIEGLKSNGDTSDTYIPISTATTRQHAADSLTVYEGVPAEVPVSCTILDR